MNIKTVDTTEAEGIKNVYLLYPIVKNDILQMSLHVFLLVDKKEKRKWNSFKVIEWQ